MISEFLSERIEANDFPSAVYLVSEKGEVALSDALGHAVVEPQIVPATPDTIYDLASVTKVLVTGLLLAQLVEEQRIALNTTLGEVLPHRPLGALAPLTLIDIATHATGLPGWLPFYLLVADRQQILTELAENWPLAPRDVVYGDPNFWLLTFIVEELTGVSITDAAHAKIFRPLGLKDTSYSPGDRVLDRVAASEKGTAFERQLCRDLGFDFTENRITGAAGFRDELIWGEVHDQNAWFFGNVCGHAGLFSTAAEVLILARQFLPEYTSILKPSTCELFTTNFTEGMAEDRSFTFQLASTSNSTAGRAMSSSSFGHLGFTGTSLWIDPDKDRIFILLTNRTHAHSLPLVNLNPIRRRFHELACEALDAKSLAT